MSGEPSFDFLLPPPPPFLPANRAFDSRSAPQSKYYQPSIIYQESNYQSNQYPSSEHEKLDEWVLHPAPAKEPRWSSDISMDHSSNNQHSRHVPQSSPDSGRITPRRLVRSIDEIKPSPLSSYPEEDLSCELDNLNINTASVNQRQTSNYQSSYCDHFDNDQESTLYERVTYRPAGRPCYRPTSNQFQLHHEQQTRSEPSTQQSINFSRPSAPLNAHLQHGPSSLIYSTTTQHGRLIGASDQPEQQPHSSSPGLFIETDSSLDSHDTYDCCAETASLSSASFSSWAASPCQSPTSPFFDTSLPIAVGTNDPVLAAGLDIFASQLHSARVRISKMTSVQEYEDQ